MNYDPVDDSGYTDEYESMKPFTIGDLANLASTHNLKDFRFVGTDLTVGTLHSWRGAYHLPAIEPQEGTKIGAEICASLSEEIRETHCGWKGGEYKYCYDDVFYVSPVGCYKEYMVVGYKVEDHEIVLLTKKVPY